MKSDNDEQKVYFERNVLIVLSVFVFGFILDALTFYLFTATSPFALVIIVPAIITNIQAIWLLLNPYIIIFKDRITIKNHILSNREFYFLDIKGFEISKKPLSLIFIYNDGDKIKLSLFGIKNNHLELLKNKLNEQVNESIKKRGF